MGAFEIQVEEAIRQMNDFRNDSRPSKAIAVGEAAEEILAAQYEGMAEPSSNESRKYVVFLCVLANCCKQAGNFDTAEHRYGKALTINPNDRVALSGWADVALKRGDLDAAEERYSNALEIAPNDVVLQNGWANVALKRGDLDAAEERIRRSIQIDNKEPYNYMLLAKIADKTENYKQKKERFNAAFYGLLDGVKPTNKRNVQALYDMAYSPLGTAWIRERFNKFIGEDKDGRARISLTEEEVLPFREPPEGWDPPRKKDNAPTPTVQAGVLREGTAYTAQHGLHSV